MRKILNLIGLLIIIYCGSFAFYMMIKLDSMLPKDYTGRAINKEYLLDTVVRVVYDVKELGKLDTIYYYDLRDIYKIQLDSSYVIYIAKDVTVEEHNNNLNSLLFHLVLMIIGIVFYEKFKNKSNEKKDSV